MDERFHVNGTKLTVLLPAELDHHIAEMLNQQTDWIVEQKNIYTIIFDFRETDFMDSSGIGVIMGRYRNIRLLGGSVRAVHVSQRIGRLLHLSGVDKLIAVSTEKPWKRMEKQKGEAYGEHE